MKKKDKKLSHSDSSTISTLLGRDTQIEGTFTFSDTIRVDGHIKGKMVSANGTVIIGENSVVEADVQVATAIIRGKVNGRVEAKQRIEIYAPAKVSGDISAPTITIDAGVVFNGKCQMHKEPMHHKPKAGAAGSKPLEKTPPKAAS
ncbi:MAG: polymer-forming cytoskeletal protein [Desulfobacteraceae bacterium]|jgi:cytoskeletal protein CcmA (bactofilin family)